MINTTRGRCAARGLQDIGECEAPRYRALLHRAATQIDAIRKRYTPRVLASQLGVPVRALGLRAGCP